jgi:hypothetical protein
MTISERDRFEMHLELKRLMGDAVADTLMEHLPPSGWGDVARKYDIDGLGNRFDGLVQRVDVLEQRLDKRIDDLEQRLDKRIDDLEERMNRRFNELEAQLNKCIDGLERRLNLAISIGSAIALALLGMQVQIMLSIAAL